MLFTIGLCYGITEAGYEGRYCYPVESAALAIVALHSWSGEGDPIGPWIKHKGGTGEYSNPNKQPQDER